MTRTSPFRNWLLAQLFEDDYRLLAPNLQATDIELGQVFYEARTPIHYTYFIEAR